MRPRPAAFFAAFAVVALALAPALSEARPGGSGSSGSRGSRTQSAPPSTQTAPGGGTQFQRTQTPPAQAPAAGAASAARPASAAAAQGSFFSRNPMMAGLMGGLLGAGLFGLLSGSGLFGGMAGLAGFMGLLLQVALIGGLIFLAMRLIRGRRQPAMAGVPGAYARDMQQEPAGVRPAMGGGAALVASQPVQVTEADFSAFAERLVAVNAAWSRQDLEALRRLSTAEMTNYFANDLKDLRARGWTNETSDVRLEQGDLSEAWNEDGQDFATVAMRFSLIDVTRATDGSVAEGSPTDRQTTTELWTFVRRQGSPWTLSAIQQTG